MKENTKHRCELIERVLEINCIPELICDEYGNYVVQVILSIAKENNESRFLSIISNIKSATKSLLQSDHGRKIYDKLQADYTGHFKQPKKKNKNKGGDKEEKVMDESRDRTFDQPERKSEKGDKSDFAFESMDESSSRIDK